MSKVTDISDKLLEKTEAVQEALKLEEEIEKYLPVEIISSSLISYCCVQHIYYKSLKSDWRDNIECFLGLPNHVQKVKDVDNYEYGVFPLSLVHRIALYSMNLFQFALSFVDIDEDEEKLIHFDFELFNNHRFEFEEALENNLNSWTRGKNTKKWEKFVQQIKKDPYKHSVGRMNIQLVHYYQKQKSNLKINIISTIVKEFFNLAIGQDYGMYEYMKKREEFDEFVEAVNYFGIEALYRSKKAGGDRNFLKFFPDVKSFGIDLGRYYTVRRYELKNDKDNHLIQEDVEILEQLFENTKKGLLKRCGIDKILNEKT